MKSSVLYLRRRFQEGDLDLVNRAQRAREYVSFLKGLRANEAEQHGIVSRHKEALECQKLIEKESARVVASKALQQLIYTVDQFDAVWVEIMIAGLPTCWDSTTPSMLRPLPEYEACLK